MGLPDDYVRVDITKILDAADSLETTVEDMKTRVETMDRELERLLKESDFSLWDGPAANEYRKAYAKRRAKVVSDIENYEKYVKFLRERVQVYLLHAADAEKLADNLDSEVSRLVADLLQASGASLREVVDEAAARAEAKSNK